MGDVVGMKSEGLAEEWRGYIFFISINMWNKKMLKILKKNRQTNSIGWNFWILNPLLELPTNFVIPFQATNFAISFRVTFIFGESQSKFFIKSYGRLKFFALNFDNSKSMINLYTVRALPSNIH